MVKAAEPDLQLLDLLVQAMQMREEKERKAGRRFRYHELHVCRNCLHSCVVEYMMLCFALDGFKQCELCGAKPGYPLYSVLICESRRRKING